MPWAIDFALRAVADIRMTLAWTESEFGTVQAARYEAQINQTLRRLENEGPALVGSSGVTARRPGLRRTGLSGRASHLLLYRQSGPDRILVLRLLHATMDLPRHVEG